MNKRSTLKVVAATAVLAFAGLTQAQQTIKIANIVEISGPGTTAGTLFKNVRQSVVATLPALSKK
jgi:branched-chain amino acid transport system substrate-binding protein